jgi:hypothetical protein
MVSLMTIQIESIRKENGYTAFEATCNKTSAAVCVGPSGVHVCAKNASASRNRFLGGKYFHNTADAVNGYKSSEMKAIITAALEAHA